MRTRAAWSVLGASCFWFVAACGNSEHSPPPAGSTAGTAGSAGSAGTGPVLSGISGDNNGSGGIGPECAGDLIEAKRLPLDMYVMLDVSGSMLLPTEGDANVTKWQAVSSALTEFVKDDASSGIGVGLQMFPILRPGAPDTCVNDADCGNVGPCLTRGCLPLIDGQLNGCFSNTGCDTGQRCVVIGRCSNNNQYVCNAETTTKCDPGLGNCVVPASTCLSRTDCSADAYAAPAAEIAELPGATAGLVATLAAATPDEAAMTPTGPALQGAIMQAKAWAKAHPDRQVVAVLATDGLPTLQTAGKLCAGVEVLEDIDAVVNLAATGREAAPVISTFVIGVVGADDVAAPVILDAIAQAGGSTEAFIVDTGGNVQQEFRAALDQIRESGLSCDLAVPESSDGKAVDYGLVNVDFASKGGTVDHLVNVGTVTGCAQAPQGQGWYYDVADANAEKPSRITVCPSTCRAFEATDMGSVQISLGCKTRSIVK